MLVWLMLVGWLGSRLTLIARDEPLSRRFLAGLLAFQLLWWWLTLGGSTASLSLAGLMLLALILPERLLPASWLNESRLAATLVMLGAVAVLSGELSSLPRQDVLVSMLGSFA